MNDGIRSLHIPNSEEIYFEQINRGLGRVVGLESLNELRNEFDDNELNRYLREIGDFRHSEDRLFVRVDDGNRLLLKFGDRYIEVLDSETSENQVGDYFEYSKVDLPEAWLDYMEKLSLMIRFTDTEVNRIPGCEGFIKK